MNRFATAGLQLLLVACATACGPTNRAQGIDGAPVAVPVAHTGSPSTLASRKLSGGAPRGNARQFDAERLRAANALAVLHIGLAGLSLPARD